MVVLHGLPIIYYINSDRRGGIHGQCHPEGAMSPRPQAKGDIGHVARHARSPFIISHRKSLMGNYIKVFFFLNHLKIYLFFLIFFRFNIQLC